MGHGTLGTPQVTYPALQLGAKGGIIFAEVVYLAPRDLMAPAAAFLLLEYSERHRGFLSLLRCGADAEFLYACVRQTVEPDLPSETEYLATYGRFRSFVESTVDMPRRTVDNRFGFLRQNGGHARRERVKGECAALTDGETREIERTYLEPSRADGTEEMSQ